MKANRSDVCQYAGYNEAFWSRVAAISNPAQYRTAYYLATALSNIESDCLAFLANVERDQAARKAKAKKKARGRKK